jgi:transcriptional regulator with XRE-family HTH domain
MSKNLNVSENSEFFMKTLGSMVRLARKKKKMNRDALAAEIGCCAATVAKIEKGVYVRVDFVIEACNSLGVNIVADSLDKTLYLI